MAVYLIVVTCRIYSATNHLPSLNDHLLFTPSDASWLNQTEALLEAFSERYLLRSSWRNRVLMIQHILNSQRDYNQRFAHPFAWEWSCRDFKYWLNNTPSLIRCTT